MTTEISSRSITLADLLATIKTAELSPSTRNDLSSAVRTVARLLDAPLEQIPADPRLLAMRLRKVMPPTSGISDRRFANVRSLLGRALALSRPILPGRSTTALSPAWVALYAGLPSRAHQVRLSRLLRWLSVQAVTPENVTQEHLNLFEVQLRQNALMTKSDDAWRATAWAWNSARKSVANWPAIEISLPSRQVTYSLPWSAFPPSLQLDVDAYLDRLSGKDPVEPLTFRPVRQSTRDTRERQIRAFASGITSQGTPMSSLQRLADLVSIENFKQGLRFFLARRADNRPSKTVADLAAAMKAVARHWVKVSSQELAAIDAVVRRVAVERVGMTAKNRARLRVFDDPERVAALVNLPNTLLRAAQSGQYSEWRSAVLAQTAVAVELLLMRPLRLDNLRTLDLDDNFVRPSRNTGCLHIVIGADQVKNAVVLENQLPEESVALLRKYLNDFRPTLCGPENRKLFPAGAGSAGCKSIGSLRIQIVRAARKYAGLEINPHLFRHIAAKLHLDQHPGEYEVVSQVLGHKSLATTRRSYTGLEVDAAVRHFDATIAKLRQSATTRTQRRKSADRCLAVTHRQRR